MGKFTSIFVSVVLIFFIKPSVLMSVEEFESSTDEMTEEASEKLVTENTFYTDMYSIPDEDEISSNTVGSYFLLNLTIEQNWTDEYFNKSSRAFKSLANNLGSELIDLVDNSVEAQEVNTTNFHLIEVRPNNQKLYVIFVMVAKLMIDGEKFNNVLTNRINMYNEIYSYKVTSEGFELKNIDKQTAEELLKSKY
jgi:hypothetical protein